MPTSQPFGGVLVPVLTPFTPAGEPDAGRFAAFCRWLLDEGADGLAIFGTTSEANSMAARRADGVSRPPGRGRIPARETDAGHRRLLDDRATTPDRARGRRMAAAAS